MSWKKNAICKKGNGREEKSPLMPTGAYLMDLLWWYHRGHHDCSAIMEVAMTLVLSQKRPQLQQYHRGCNDCSAKAAMTTAQIGGHPTATLSWRPPNCSTFTQTAMTVVLSWRLPLSQRLLQTWWDYRDVVNPALSFRAPQIQCNHRGCTNLVLSS